MIARVLVVLLVGTATARAAGWTVKPPAGWVEDKPEGAAMRAKVRSGFFEPARVSVEGTIYRDADPKSKLVVQVVHAELDQTPREALAGWAKRVGGTPRYRTDGDDAVADIDLASDGYPTRMMLRARRDDGLMHMLVIACSEPRGHTSCTEAFASVGVAEDPATHAWGMWVAIGGAALIVIGFVGRRLEDRRHKRA